jgi:hypothetical protein
MIAPALASVFRRRPIVLPSRMESSGSRRRRLPAASNTRKIVKGSHSLYAVAVDVAGNRTAAATVSVTAR